jgi:hypothetical protein
MQKMIRVSALMLGISLLSGCATIAGDRYNHVNLATTPQGADYEVRNAADQVVASGVTPNLVKLKSSAGYFKRGSYTVLFRKPGYEDVQVPLAASMRGLYWGNLLVGGPIGMLIVDPASGAMWALPKAVTGELTANTTAQAAPAPQLSTADTALSQDQQLQELQQQQLSYEEYQRRYREIMGQ